MLGCNCLSWSRVTDLIQPDLYLFSLPKPLPQWPQGSEFATTEAQLAESKKRRAEDYLASDRTKLAKSLVSTSVSSVMGAYPSTPNQWPAGYGVQPQAWPQASQTQAQQWCLGYPQQAFAQPAYAQPAVATTPAQQTNISVTFDIYHDEKIESIVNFNLN